MIEREQDADGTPVESVFHPGDTADALHPEQPEPHPEESGTRRPEPRSDDHDAEEQARGGPRIGDERNHDEDSGGDSSGEGASVRGG